MFHRKRVGATMAYLITLAATLAVAFGVPNYTDSTETTATPGKGAGIIALVAIQFCALVWYTASYIPFARDLLVKTGGWAVRAVTGR